jgi:hypothetical protein
MNRKAWIAFVVVQIFGELGPWAGLRMKSSFGAVLWVIGIVVMMPGRLLSLFITEKTLWNAPLTPAQMTTLFVAVEVAANLLVWLLCARLLQSLRHRRAGKAISRAVSL